MSTRLNTLTLLVVLVLFISGPAHAQFHEAVTDGDLQEVNRLIAEGADVNGTLSNGLPLLAVASHRGHIDRRHEHVATGAAGGTPYRS